MDGELGVFLKLNRLMMNERLNSIFLLNVLLLGVLGVFVIELSKVEMNAVTNGENNLSSSESNLRRIQILQGTSSRMRSVNDDGLESIQPLNDQNGFISSNIVINGWKVMKQIVIDGNVDFANQALLNGWPGSGTKTDPYVIENVLFSGIINNQTRVMVDIRNVDVHFIFRNDIVTVNDSFIIGGIRLTNVSNGILEKLVIDSQINSVFGIGLKNSFNNTIRECSVKNVSIGIKLFENSLQNQIIANDINAQAASLYISYGSRDNWIINNSFQHSGIILDTQSSVASSILQAKVTGNRINGRPLIFWQDRIGGSVPRDAGQIILVNCTNIVIDGQEITGVTRGIQLYHLNNSVIINNIVRDDKNSGIYLDHGFNNTFKNNTVQSSKNSGFYIAYSYNITLTDNVAINNTQDGFTLDLSSEIRLENNIAIFNGYSGFFIDNSANFVLVSNIAEKNEEDGFRIGFFSLMLGRWAVIQRNLAQSNSWDGISFDELMMSENITITNNTLIRNGQRGIYLFSISSSAAVRVNYNAFLNNSQSLADNQAIQFGFIAIHPEIITMEYNYWSDHVEPDDDGDGIVDVPYPSDNVSIMDPYPLTTLPDSPPEHLIGQVRFVNPSDGEVITDSLVPVEWTAVNDSWNHSVKYDLFIFIASNSTNESELALDIQNTDYSLEVANYPNGSVIHLRVIAKDLAGVSSESTSSFIILFVINESSQNSSSTRSSRSLQEVTSWPNIFIIVGMMTTFFLLKSLNARRKQREGQVIF